ncbi:hypothetical protein FRC00_003774 [Tulasnella sp. 408]|nr:hypothetical protein FRC00_003774 [Tulasnella sp. 408]
MLIRSGAATGERQILSLTPIRRVVFELRTSAIQSHPLQFALISRSARHRAGTRDFTRGVNAKGIRGNFNESEQIFISTPPSSPNNVPSVASYVQTRGSAPFYWAEIINLICVPDLIIMDKGAESHAAFRAYIDNQVDTYGKLLLLNLVKGRGREKHVKDSYEDLVRSEKDRDNKENEKGANSMDVEGDNKGIMDAVDYVQFDLHSEMSGDKCYRVDEKTKELDRMLENHGRALQLSSSNRSFQPAHAICGFLSYFEAGPDPQASPVKVQSGVVRTDCMDFAFTSRVTPRFSALMRRVLSSPGLDRTNLMQTSIAKTAIDKQAHDLGLLTHPKFSVEKEGEFIKTFREVWSGPGNFIATAYIGTGALRTDFNRTGVRTKKGVAFDKLTSVWRYILNNHLAGYKQARGGVQFDG